MRTIKNILFLVLFFGFLLAIGFVGQSSIKEVEIESDLKGKIIEFTRPNLYEANKELNFDDKEKNVLTSDIVPDRIIQVSQREYVEEAKHIKTVDVPLGVKYEVIKKVTYDKKCSGMACLGDDLPVDKYYLKETSGIKTIRAYVFERELKEKRVIIH